MNRYVKIAEDYMTKAEEVDSSVLITYYIAKAIMTALFGIIYELRQLRKRV